jgi:nicotinamidase-related amidase
MSRTALIVTDMLNRYEHEDAPQLMESVREALPGICVLIDQARERDVAVVYVNDNHEDWSAGRDELVEWAMTGADSELIKPIVPRTDFAFVVKARHSAFYETQLDYLLRRQHTERLVLAGQVTEQCVLYSALDAYVRRYEVVIARDAVAHIHPELASAALNMMERNMRARIVTASEVAW